VKIIMALLTVALGLSAAEPDLMPMPAQYAAREGRFAIDQGFKVTLSGYREARLERAAARLMERLSRQTGMPFTQSLNQNAPSLDMRCTAASKAVQALGEDESYTLEIDSKQARLTAANPLGVLRGMETFLQLVKVDREGFGIQAASIEDKPRFPWRGLSFDVSRHWMPMEVVKRNLDGLAAVKMNVFHWHLTDDQGFRIESKIFPELQQKGSDGHYYTQAQIREVIEYARDRGIRVVPEFDMPGHTTSWLVSHPELAAAPGPYQIERKWGIFDPTLDSTNEAVYPFLDRFIGEMAALFPDQYFHVGGDEVSGKQWTASQHIQTYIREHKLAGNHELQRMFTRRVQAIVQKHGKVMEGWDEVLDPDLPKNIVIHSWRGQKSLAQAARQGYSGLLSAGYYLDLMHSAAQHYAVDPLDQSTAGLTTEERARILGGEAAMWVEYASTETVDSRLWPRTAPIAERLWSPATVRDVPSMYRRMGVISQWLDTLGLRHNSNYRPMLERITGGASVEPLKTLADVVEPLREYNRGQQREYTQFTPLNRLIDAARPESDTAREFQNAIAAKEWGRVRSMLITWRDNDAVLKPIIERSALLPGVGPLSSNLAMVADIGLDALARVEKGEKAPADWAAGVKAKLDAAKKPQAEVLLMPVIGVETLVQFAQ
jgi:hexosaminidase